MTQNITTYYIPQNLNIKKGKIYALYLNKNNNLDLTSIISNNQTKKQNEITISKDDYNKLLLLIDTSTKLYSQSQELAREISNGRKK